MAINEDTDYTDGDDDDDDEKKPATLGFVSLRSSMKRSSFRESFSRKAALLSSFRKSAARLILDFDDDEDDDIPTAQQPPQIIPKFHDEEEEEPTYPWRKDDKNKKAVFFSSNRAPNVPSKSSFASASSKKSSRKKGGVFFRNRIVDVSKQDESSNQLVLDDSFITSYPTTAKKNELVNNLPGLVSRRRSLSAGNERDFNDGYGGDADDDSSYSSNHLTLFKSGHHKKQDRKHLAFASQLVTKNKDEVHPTTLMKNKSDLSWKRYRLSLMIGVFIVSVVITIVALTLPDKIKASSRTIPSDFPPTDPTTAIASSSISSFKPSERENGRVSLIQSRMPSITFEDASSPQSKALRWMLDEDDSSAILDDKWIQRFVLVTLWYSTNGEIWDSHGRWLQPNLDECDWNQNDNGESDSGRKDLSLRRKINNEIVCKNDDLLVHELFVDFNYFSLYGTIPAELALLTHLTVLSLVGNTLGGTIPPEMSDSLTNLVSLQLSHNRLIGSIPSELQHLTKLTTLTLGSNEFTGSIPSELSSLSQLSILDLHDNLLSASIPSGIGNLSNLKWLYLNDNPSLGGTLPSDSFENLQQLSRLKIQYTNVQGTIPSSLCSVKEELHQKDIEYKVHKVFEYGAAIKCHCCINV